MAATRRDHLVDTALQLFSRHGFHATGIDRILSESGVAKMTLYKHFKSKDDLILAALRRRDELHRTWLIQAVETKATAPRDRLVALFAVLADWFCSDDFAGCCFINASAEYSAKENPIHQAAAEHKLMIRAYILDQAQAAGAKPAVGLTDQIMLLIDGATVAAQVHGGTAPAMQAQLAAEILIGQALAAGSIAA